MDGDFPEIERLLTAVMESELHIGIEHVPMEHRKVLGDLHVWIRKSGTPPWGIYVYGNDWRKCLTEAVRIAVEAEDVREISGNTYFVTVDGKVRQA